MRSVKIVLGQAAIALILFISTAAIGNAGAETSFPFGMEMTLDRPPMPGSKRIPDLDIADNGEVTLLLWCKSGKGQFSVAGNTLVFVAGPLDDHACTPERAAADDALIAALSEATSWKREGDAVSFIGNRELRFHLVTD